MVEVNSFAPMLHA